MGVSWKSAAITLLLIFSLISHAQGAETSPTSVPYTKWKSFSAPLNGNWHLTGVHYFRGTGARLPFISFAIVTDGDQIKGRGSLLVGCQNSPGMRTPSITVTGKIAPDGTFEADDYKSLYQVQFSIHGTVPQSGDTTWQGAYTLKNSSTESDCVIDESGAFTATKYPSFTGTFSGTIAGFAVTAQITQGDPGDYSREGFSIPLGGQITVLGLPCFTRGAATETRTNLIRGDEFWLTFSMEDGSLLHLNGYRFLDDSVEPTIEDVHFFVEGGRCHGAGGPGTLTLR